MFTAVIPAGYNWGNIDIIYLFISFNEPRLYFELTKSQTPLRYLVADRSEAGRRPAASWNLAYHLARWQRASRSATSFRPVCDQIV